MMPCQHDFRILSAQDDSYYCTKCLGRAIVRLDDSLNEYVEMTIPTFGKGAKR